MTRNASKGQGSKGFTLIELLIVIGIIGILAAIILVAVDPAKRLKQARNARRFAETNALLNAVLNYTVDFKGRLPNVINSATNGFPYMIGSGNAVATTFCPAAVTGETYAATNTRDLGADTVLVDQYISEMPIDPRGVNDNGDTYTAAATGYYFLKSANGRVTVGSCNPESEDNVTTPQIKVKR